MTAPSPWCFPQTIGLRVSEPKNPLLSYGAVAGLALIWGASFLFIEIAIEDMSPTVLVLTRAGSGFVALAVVVFAMRRTLVGKGWRTRHVPYAIKALGG